MRFGIVTDVHVGPRASYEGKLRKLSDLALPLLARAIEELRSDGVSLLAQLGDAIQDRDEAADREGLERFLHELDAFDGPVVHVAGNHDRYNLPRGVLEAAFGAPLVRSLDHEGVHFVTLATEEERDVAIRLPTDQLEWLRTDLGATTLPTIVLVHHPLSDQQLFGNRWFESQPHLCRVANRRAVRHVLEEAGNVVAVFNGHAHWNHVDVIGGIPYVTLQSLIENVDDDAPGRAANTRAVVSLSDRWLHVDVRGQQPLRFQWELAPAPADRH